VKKQASLIILHYFRLLAKLQLAKVDLLCRIFYRRHLTIIGVTGSAGKSSTINTLLAALSPQFKVKSSGGSNSESGIPLNILDVKVGGYSPLEWLKYSLLAPLSVIFNWRPYQIYLAEMGIDGPDEPKNMSYLLRILRPSIGIFLNVNPVHSVYFDHTVPNNLTGSSRLHQIIQNIGQEKVKMLFELRPHGTAILNLDDPIVAQTTLGLNKSKLTFGSGSGSGFDLRLLPPKIDSHGSTFDFKFKSQTLTASFPRYLLPATYQTSLAATILAASILGQDPSQTLKNIQDNLHLPPSRSSLLPGLHHSTLIDSTYNSSPSATQEMLKLLSLLPSPRLAILGDMRELGQQSALAHQEIYRLALQSCDQLLSIGPETSKYFGSKAIKFTYWWQAANYLLTHPQLLDHAYVLVKGSQNTIYLEELVKSLLENPQDSAQLCRQSPHWLKIKDTFKNHSSN
jgi:UDP-N-acetylmuramoyl-tripeptide--D-alanyl-D-alanine ligase